MGAETHRSMVSVCLAMVFALSGAAPSRACTVPVFRYALERWPADPHTVILASNVVPSEAVRAAGHHANFWIERGGAAPATDLAILGPDESAPWYEGPWRPGLLTELADSPLRRRIAQELLTGTTAAFVLLQSDDPATNAAVARMLKDCLTELANEIELPEQPDYQDEADGWTGPDQGQALSKIPMRVAFTLHQVARADEDEAFFVRQIASLAPASATPATPIVAVVFGQGHTIPLVGEELTPEIIAEVCWFLCGPCSCRIKALNPGVDLLMAVNWDDALLGFPEPATTVLPDGTEFSLGGTATVVFAAATMATGPIPQQAAPHARPGATGRRGRILLAAGLAVGAGVLLACLLISPWRSALLRLLTTRAGVRRDPDSL